MAKISEITVIFNRNIKTYHFIYTEGTIVQLRIFKAEDALCSLSTLGPQSSQSS